MVTSKSAYALAQVLGRFHELQHARQECSRAADFAFPASRQNQTASATGLYDHRGPDNAARTYPSTHQAALKLSSHQAVNTQLAFWGRSANTSCLSSTSRNIRADLRQCSSSNPPATAGKRAPCPLIHLPGSWTVVARLTPGASSMTTTSSMQNTAAVRASRPATAVASSIVCVFSITEPGTASETVHDLPCRASSPACCQPRAAFLRKKQVSNSLQVCNASACLIQGGSHLGFTIAALASMAL